MILSGPFVESITRIRYAAGATDTSGRWVKGAATELALDASVQVLSGDELRQELGELEETSHAVQVLSHTEMRTGDESSETTADRLRIGGEEYEVQRVYHVRQIHPHYSAVAVRMVRR